MRKQTETGKSEGLRNDFLVFGSPLIEEEDIQEVVDCLRSGWISTGPRVAKFEELVKEYMGSGYACAVSSCTAGLHLSLIVAGIGAGDEVITSPMTFGATANVIIHSGAKPVFVDVDRKTMNIDTSLIEEKITKKTKAIIPVHFAGRPCDMDAIIEIANKHGLLVISDAAHSFEAEYKGVKTGNIGDMNAFSFYVTKNLAMGEGGIVTTNKKEWAEKIQTYALHGLDKDAWQRYSSKTANQYRVVYPGFKYNLMDMQAALGIKQIKRLEKSLEIRNRIWALYDKAFSGLPVTIPAPIEDCIKHARHLYTLLIDIDQLSFDRDEFRQKLHNKNIGTGIHFIALHLHPYYVETFGYKRGDFPNAEYISDRTISLPFSAKLTEEDVNDVIVNVTNIFKL